MSHIVQRIFRFQAGFIIFIGGVFLVSILTISGCVSAPTGPGPLPQTERVFFREYDQVWRAARAVVSYPIAVENFDVGMIETEFIPAVMGWKVPESKMPLSSGVRYKLILRLSKGQTDKKTATKVSVEKKIERTRDFLSTPEEIHSDGWEEFALLYRIERELQIQGALKKKGLL